MSYQLNEVKNYCSSFLCYCQSLRFVDILQNYLIMSRFDDVDCHVAYTDDIYNLIIFNSNFFSAAVVEGKKYWEWLMNHHDDNGDDDVVCAVIQLLSLDLFNDIYLRGKVALSVCWSSIKLILGIRHWILECDQSTSSQLRKQVKMRFRALLVRTFDKNRFSFLSLLNFNWLLDIFILIMTGI